MATKITAHLLVHAEDVGVDAHPTGELTDEEIEAATTKVHAALSDMTIRGAKGYMLDVTTDRV